jgi:hypothetical protein
MWNRWVYYPKIVADGNFKLDHVIPKCPEKDVWLSDGHQFMTGESAYQKHLAISVEEMQVCSVYIFLHIGWFSQLFKKYKCQNHRAISQANVHHKDHLRATGVGACACANHGCFYPHSVVDFQKGERYVLLVKT